MAKCGSCGAALIEGAHYCGECGAAVPESPPARVGPSPLVDSATQASAAGDERVAERTVLDEQVAELERLGFMISSPSDFEIIATRGKWHWDCLFTHLTVVVFLKATTGVLSWSHITDETDELLARARELDADAGSLQHGVAALQVYVADRVDPEVQYLCDSRQAPHWGAMSFPAALDRSTGQAYFRRRTPFWGGIYLAKFRFLAARLLEPASAPAREPLSVLGLVLTMIIPAVFVIALLSAFLFR